MIQSVADIKIIIRKTTVQMHTKPMIFGGLGTRMVLVVVVKRRSQIT